QSLDDRTLRFGLAGGNDVVDLGAAAQGGVVPTALERRNPAVMLVGIAVELAVAEVAAEQAKLPHVIGDVFANVADGAVGADDDFLVFFGYFVGLDDFLCALRSLLCVL